MMRFFFSFINPQLHHIVTRMTFFDTLLFSVIHFIDKLDLWHRLPVLLGLAYLGIRRYLHQRYNLLHVGRLNTNKYDLEAFAYRTADGKCNDPRDHNAGSQGTFIGRNMPPATSHYDLLDPHPSLVATKLLGRRKYKENGKQFNMIACAWVQFMIHDWVDHLEDENQVDLRAPEEIASGCPLKSFKFFRTKKVPTGQTHIKTASSNTRTPWWDGSVIYGNNEDGMRRVRTFKEGKLKIKENEETFELEHDEQGIAVSGDIRNGWAGFSVLQALFIKEHNAVCDMLKNEYPDLEDEGLYRHARLVTSAVIAKIHTIEWTVQLLKTDTLLAAMRVNWYGLFGKRIKDLYGNVFGPSLSGLVGFKKPRNHGVPYSITEEFASVYRMHSLLPDKLVLKDIESTSLDYQDEICMTKMIGKEGERSMSQIGIERMLVSMGSQSTGHLCLWNYPNWMRNLVPHDVNGEDRPDPVDMAALEIYRDRERGVVRYNEFRRNLLMIPISKWEDLTDDQEVVDALYQVYGNDVEKLDLLVGLHAENKIKGFAISETAFFIFVLMASRRLEADRFFTTNFNARTYTEKGLEWVNKTETLKDVIDRHFPVMTMKWMRCSSAFAVWDSEPDESNWLPLYLR